MSKLPFPVIARKMHFLRLQLEELASEIVIHEVLPNEIFIMILKKLSYSSINISRETCKHWKATIDRFELVKTVMRKYIFKHNDFLKSNVIFSFSVKANHSCIIIAGGWYMDSVDVLAKGLKNKRLPNLPSDFECTLMTKHNGAILAVGRRNQSEIGICLQLDHGSWKDHSTLNKVRSLGQAITTDIATFIFGGVSDDYSTARLYEFLPKDSSKWQLGQNEIPGSFFIESCAISVNSRQEIWLIGGHNGPSQRILGFDVKNHTFRTLPSRLIVCRKAHKGIMIPGTNKIMITGGRDFHNPSLDSTEIIDIDTGSVSFASPMNTPRSNHGIGIININDEDRVAVFGGTTAVGKVSKSVEIYNHHTKKWEKSEFNLTECKKDFGFLSVKLGDISKYFS